MVHHFSVVWQLPRAEYDRQFVTDKYQKSQKDDVNNLFAIWFDGHGTMFGTTT
jgi:hypothetical protein